MSQTTPHPAADAVPAGPDRTEHVTVGAELSIQGDVAPVLAPDGTQIGWRLADGRVVKPWLTFEVMPADEATDGTDCSHAEAAALGITLVQYTQKDIEPVEAT